jgi:hypothetical protein
MAYKSLTHSLKSRLRECVGESYWKNAEDLLAHFFRQEQLRNLEELESSRPLPPQPQHKPPPQNHPKDDEKHGDESFTTKNGDVKTGDWFNSPLCRTGLLFGCRIFIQSCFVVYGLWGAWVYR